MTFSQIAWLALTFLAVSEAAVMENNKVGFETTSFSIFCSSKVPPMWSWVGKNTNDIKSMAFGTQKQIQFKEPR